MIIRDDWQFRDGPQVAIYTKKVLERAERPNPLHGRVKIAYLLTRLTMEEEYHPCGTQRMDGFIERGAL